MTRVISIDEKLHRQFQREARSRDTKLYLVGADVRGVCMEGIVIADNNLDGGCHVVPGASNEKLIKAYFELSIKKLVPVAFVHLYPDLLEGNPIDDGSAGDDISNYPGMVFITYGVGRGACEARTISKTSEIEKVDVRIIK